MSSFVKDRDAHTRGVNAIAAVDGATMRARQREAVKARQMRARDHRMAAMANAAFKPLRHSLSSLGALPMVNKLSWAQVNPDGVGVKLTDNAAPRAPGGGGPMAPSGGYTSTPPRPANQTAGSMLANLSTSAKLASVMRPGALQPGGTQRPANQTSGGGVTLPPGTGFGTGPFTGGKVPPRPLPLPTSTSSGSAGTGTTSSATSGGGYGSAPATDYAEMTDLVTSPSAETVLDVVSSPPMSKNTKLLLIAGAAVGAYLLLRKKG